MRKKRIIIDAGCILAVIFKEDLANDVIKKTSGMELYSADCLSYEVCNSLTKWIKRDLITAENALKCFELYKSIPVKKLECNPEKALFMAGEEKQYIYDMFYLECAQRTGYPLFTFDEKMIAIAKKRGIECL